MAVKVIKHRVRAGGKVYTPGEIISCLDEQGEQELVNDGYCSFVEVEKSSKKKQPKEEEEGPNTGLPMSDAK